MSRSWGSRVCVCCTAIQPAHVKCLEEECKVVGVTEKRVAELVTETGGEDMPDAYRWVPNDPEEAN